MTQNTPASPQAEDYDAIHTAVMETSRGNWFLTEFARRNRNADTALLLAAIKRIESAVRIQTAIPVRSNASGGAAEQSQFSGAIEYELHELRDAIVLTKESLPAIGPDRRIALRNADFTRIAAGIELVASAIRSTGEQALETASSLRERAQKEFGLEKDALDRRAGELEAHARELSGFYAQLGEQIESARMVATLLAEVEARLDGMIARQKEAAAGPAVIGPPPPVPDAQAAAIGQSQTDPQPARTPADPVAVNTPPAPQAQTAVVTQSQTDPKRAQDVVTDDPVPEPAAFQPAQPAAPPDNPNLDFEGEATPAAALPNPALREAAVSETASQPAPPQPEPMPEPEPAYDAAPVLEVAALPAQSEASDDPADCQFDPLSHALQSEPQSAPGNGAEHAQKPAPMPLLKRADPLGPIAALSDEEKIALFS